MLLLKHQFFLKNSKSFSNSKLFFHFLFWVAFWLVCSPSTSSGNKPTKKQAIRGCAIAPARFWLTKISLASLSPVAGFAAPTILATFYTQNIFITNLSEVYFEIQKFIFTVYSVFIINIFFLQTSKNNKFRQNQYSVFFFSNL